MLEKQISTLHKKLFFHSVICLVLVSFFIWRAATSYSELKGYSDMIHMTKKEISNIEQKIRYASDYEGAANIVYQAYSKELLNDSSTCAALTNLTAEYTDLANKFRIKNAPTIEVLPTPIMDSFRNHKNIFILSNEFFLTFQALGFRHAASFVKSAYQLLPSGSMIKELEMTVNTDASNQPSIVTTLQSIDTKAKMQVREVRVRKSE